MALFPSPETNFSKDTRNVVRVDIRPETNNSSDDVVRATFDRKPTSHLSLRHPEMIDNPHKRVS